MAAQQQQAHKPTPSAMGTQASRLDQQPWPATMGQPYVKPAPQVAMAAPPPAIQQAPLSYQEQNLQSMTSNKIQVALLLPLSGKHAALGQAMLNAAQLAVFDMAPQNFELMPRDTGGTPESAALAARDAMASGAQLLIGPLFAADVAAVKPLVQTSNVNMLALSTDVSLAEPGAYVMGFAPAPQVDRVVAYAAQQGAKRFAAIVPPTPYGALVQKAFEASVRRQGGAVVASLPLAKLAELAAQKDSIDALFLPFGGNELKQLAAQLETAGFDRNKVHMLGTGLWDEAGIGSAPLLVGGWYAASEPDARAAFIANYAKTYGQEPPRLATLAYDATALAAVLATQGGHFDRASLGNPSGFAGLDGIFRFTSGGQAERGLAIDEVTATGNRVIDPAPSTFVKGP